MCVRALALLCAALAGCSSGASVPQPPAPNIEAASMLVPRLRSTARRKPARDFGSI